MKRILVIASIVALVLVVGVFTLPFLVPSSVYRAQIETAATNALGREVTLLGEARLSVFPSISARIGGAQVANPEQFEGEYFIEAGELKGSVKLWPLLSRSVEIDEITLSDATIRLERLENGDTNWQFGDDNASTSDNDKESTGGLSGGIARARLTNTAIYYNDRTTDQQYALTDFNAEARMIASDKPFTSSGNGRINGQAFDYDVTLETLELLTSEQPSGLEVDLDTDYGRVRYDGQITLEETPYLNGGFAINSDTFGAILGFVAADLPLDPAAINSLRSSGNLTGPASALGITFESLDFNATGLSLDFEGGVQLGDTPTIDGALTLKADRAERALKQGVEFAPLISTLGEVNLTADISGALAEPSLSGIKLEQRSPLLTTDYQGAFSLSGRQVIDGTLSTSSTDLPTLLGLLGTELPDSSQLKAFSLSGAATGTVSNLMLNNAALALDDTRATGSLGADLQGAKPRIAADLDMPILDLTPFLGNSSETTASQPSLSKDWNDDPLALDGLKAVDATIDIAADRVIIDRVELEDALLKTRLDNGRLSAIFRQDEDKPGFRAFDGNWSGDVVIDASRSIPTMTVEAIADSIAAQKMLNATTGFNRLTGFGDIHMDLSSSGTSIKGLVNSLDGKFETDLNDGALKGLNLAKLVRDGASLQQLIASGNLSVASFREAISPEAETDFSNLLGALTFTDGIAQINQLTLDNPVVMVSGSGQIDLGARTIDIRLVPAVDVNAQRQGSSLSLEDIPIPVRIYGDWSNVKYGLDTAAVQAELVARARGQVVDEISDRIGGELGEIIGQRPAGDEAEETEERTLEDDLTDAALGAIFGKKSSDDSEDAE